VPSAVAASRDPVYRRWMEMELRRQKGELELDLSTAADDDLYGQWYKSGGYSYNPLDSRDWLINETSLADLRGTCLDIGSGDGFWSILLSEWYHVTGIDPVVAGVEVANAIKGKLDPIISRRVDYVVGDALDYDVKHDVVFCRAPSFLNYPVEPNFSKDMLDLDLANFREVIARTDHDAERVERRVLEYAKSGGFPYPPPPGVDVRSLADEHPYANRFRECLEQMLALTNKMFLFILSTSEPYGRFVGSTYCHDPESIAKAFADYGDSHVRMCSDSTYIIGEIFV
jgi:SAM-dependent methyltransferase